VKTVNIEVEVSSILDVDGVETYFFTDENPTMKTSIDKLIIEFLDSREINGEYHHKEDIEQVRDAFQRGLDTLNAALKNG